MITSALLLLLSRFCYFFMQFIPAHRYRHTHTNTHRRSHSDLRKQIERMHAHTDSLALCRDNHAHTNTHKTSDLCRGLSHISHFSQCCRLFPSGLTHPKTSINRPSRSVFVCRCAFPRLCVCVVMGQAERSLILQTSSSFN